MRQQFPSLGQVEALAFAVEADRSRVVQQGEITKEDTHDGSPERGGLYAALYSLQLGAEA